MKNAEDLPSTDIMILEDAHELNMVFQFEHVEGTENTEVGRMRKSRSSR